MNQSSTNRRVALCRRWCALALKPSLPDFILLILMLAAFGRPQSWQGLLADGDTGWHIRTGDLILQTGRVPVTDPFSFSRPGQPWFAWEWLADVAFSFLNRWHGLETVAAFAAFVWCLAAVVLLCWVLRRGAGLWVAVGVVLATMSASSIHSLARPHLFSFLFAAVALFLLDEDRRRPGPCLWLLVPLSALWANLHAGFVSWIAILGFLVLVLAIQRNWLALHRYATLTGLCAAATLVNPYGWQLHRHIAQYLGSSWILNHVQEFQSPDFRSESMLVFAAMLLLGVALSSRAMARGQWFEGVLVVAWGFAGLRSARHVPLYMVAAAPLIATECANWWSDAASRRPARSVLRIFWDVAQDLGRSRRISVWAPLLAALAAIETLPDAHLRDFPSATFPVAAVTANLPRLVDGAMPRILTSDQWADYLIYRLYPRQRVFFDGRSDFYGPDLGGQYQALQALGHGWRETLERHRFELALLPVNWPLGDVLEHAAGWRVIYRDSICVLLERQLPASGSKEISKNCRTYTCG